MSRARSALLILLAFLILATGWVALRTARATCEQPNATPALPISVDVTSAARRLAAAVRFKTISHPGSDQFEPRAFTDLHALLQQSFPRAHRTLTREIVNRYSLLYTWNGTDSSRMPALFLAHQDVAPVDPGTAAHWTHPPFAGRIADGYVWGRGTLDDKGSLLGPLTKAVYRFLPVQLATADLNRFHGTNERIAIESYEKLIHFYVQLLRNSATSAMVREPPSRTSGPATPLSRPWRGPR